MNYVLVKGVGLEPTLPGIFSTSVLPLYYPLWRVRGNELHSEVDHPTPFCKWCFSFLNYVRALLHTQKYAKMFQTTNKITFIFKVSDFGGTPAVENRQRFCGCYRGG